MFFSRASYMYSYWSALSKHATLYIYVYVGVNLTTARGHDSVYQSHFPLYSYAFDVIRATIT